MKRLFGTFVLTLISFFFFINSNSIAQDERHFYTITTWKMTVPADGSNKELNELFKEWHDKIVVKNDKIISEKVLRHSNGNDSRDWVVITEYASWNDIDEAGKIQNKLVDEAWPKKEDRQKFFKDFGKYSVMHTDEILQDNPKLTK